MSIKSYSSGTSSNNATLDIPEKLKKTIEDCHNSSEILDSLLKVCNI